MATKPISLFVLAFAILFNPLIAHAAYSPELMPQVSTETTLGRSLLVASNWVFVSGTEPKGARVPTNGVLFARARGSGVVQRIVPEGSGAGFGAYLAMQDGTLIV